MKAMSMCVWVVAASGCSLGARYYPGLDDRVGGGVQFMTTTPGLVDDRAVVPYGRVAGAVIFSERVPSETIPDRDDEWSGMCFDLEGGFMVRVAGDDKGMFWASIGVRAGLMHLLVMEALPDDAEGRRQWENDEETHVGGGPMLRFGYGWVHESRERPKGHCSACHEETEAPLKRRMRGPELGIGYASYADLGLGPVVELSFLTIGF